MKKSAMHNSRRKGRNKLTGKKQTLLAKLKNSILVQSFLTINLNFIFSGLFDLLSVILLAFSAKVIFSLLYNNLQAIMPLYKAMLSIGSLSSANLKYLNVTQLEPFYNFNSMLPKLIAVAAAGYILFVLLNSLFSSIVYSKLSRMPLTAGLIAKNFFFTLPYFALFALIFMQGMRFNNIYLLAAYLIIVCAFMLTFYFTSKTALVYGSFLESLKKSLILLCRNAHSFILAYLSLAIMFFIALSIFGIFFALNKTIGLMLFFISLLFMLSWLRNYFIAAYNRRFRI